VFHGLQDTPTGRKPGLARHQLADGAGVNEHSVVPGGIDTTWRTGIANAAGLQAPHSPSQVRREGLLLLKYAL